MQIEVFENRDACLRAFANFVVDFLATTLSRQERASFAVSGGRTPAEAFPMIADAPLDWSRIDLTLTDERWVAPDHPDSNEGLARRHLLRGAAAAARMVGFHDGSAVAGNAVPTVEARLASLHWPLDLIYLGVGEDGHIASLFPGGDWTAAGADARCVATVAADGRPRLSLSPAAITAAQGIAVLAPGKRAILERASAPGDVAEWPLRLIVGNRAAIAFTCD